MKCLIIAAGQGTRISSVGDCKPLIPLLGKPLIVRVIETIKSAGIMDFCVVTGYNRQKLENALTDIQRDYQINIDVVFNPQWEKPNGISVFCAKERINEPFFLVMSDHIFDAAIIRKMTTISPDTDGHCVTLAVDTRLKDNPVVDLEDVTRVHFDPQTASIIDIGKHINEYNAFDTGIFFCSPCLFSALEESIEKGDASLSGGIRTLAARGKVGVIDIEHSFWIDVDNEEMLQKAETFIDRRNA
ncbi:MAG: NTP transferase domain-containing protein [Candidatus Omnitrophota bacterium]